MMMTSQPPAPTYWAATAGPEPAGVLTASGLARFPLPFLRHAYLAGACVAYSVEDRWF